MDAHRPAASAGGYFGGLGGGSITSRAIQPLLDSDPRQIGPYAIRGRLGQGAMGHVYLAFAPTGPAYALKVLRPDFASDGDFRRRFAREIAAARAVHSPFVNAVTDADPDAPTPWLASYFIPGPPLNAAVNLAGPFSPRSVAHLGVGIGLALQAIHTAGVVHRDLKPGNVLVASDGPRVIDFGIARAADASMLTSTGMRLGTPSFMAPEQVSGSNVGAPADVWAIGGMLVYAATGRTPFGDGNAMAILYRVENHEPDLEDLDPALAAIVERCLEKDPEARPTPAKLVELCRAALYGGAEGIPVLPGTDSTGWLPPAISRDLASRAVELASVRQSQVGIPVSSGGAGSAAGAVGTAAGAAASGGGKARGLLGRKAKGGAAAPRPPQAGPQGSGPQGPGPQGSGPHGAPMGPPAGPGPQGYGSPGYGPPPVGAQGPQNYATPPQPQPQHQPQPGFGPQNGPQNYPAQGGPAGAPGPRNYPTPNAPQGAPGQSAPPPTMPMGVPGPTLPLGGPAGAPAQGPSAPAGAPTSGPGPQGASALQGGGPAWNAAPAAAPVSTSGPQQDGGAAPGSAWTPASSNADPQVGGAPGSATTPSDPDELKGPAWSTALSSRATEVVGPELDRSLISTPAEDASRGPAAAGSMPWSTASEDEAGADSEDSAEADDSDDSAEPPAASEPSGPFGPAGSLQSRPAAENTAEASPTAGLPAGFRQIEEEPKKVAEVRSTAFSAPAAPVAAKSGSGSGDEETAEDGDTSSSADDLLSSFGSPAKATDEVVEDSDAAAEDSVEDTAEDAAEDAADAQAALPFAAPVPPRNEGSSAHDVTTPIPSQAPKPAGSNAHDVTTPIPPDASKWASAKTEPVASPWTAPVSSSASSAHDVTVVNPLPNPAQGPAVTRQAPPVPQPAASFAPPVPPPAAPAPGRPANGLGTPMTGTPMTGTPMTGTPMTGTPMTGTPNPGFGPNAAAPTHMTVVPPPPSMSSPYGPGGPGGPVGPNGLPAYDDRSGGRPTGAGAGAPGGRNKRLAMIIGAAVVAVGGLGAAAVAMTGGDKNTPVADPTASSAPATGGPSQSGTPAQSPTTPAAPASSTPAPLTGTPGRTAGAVGAQDVVLRGLYGAAADHNWSLLCSSLSPTAQGLAAKPQGWNGKGDPMPLCMKFYEKTWGPLDPAHLRAVKVLSTAPGADARHMLVTIDDLSEDGKKPTRTLSVSWNGQRWVIG